MAKNKISGCGSTIIFCGFTGYFINFMMPISSSWAYYSIVGPITIITGSIIAIIGIIISIKKSKANNIYTLIDSLVKQDKDREALELVKLELEKFTGRPQSEIGEAVARLKGIKMTLEYRLRES